MSGILRNGAIAGLAAGMAMAVYMAILGRGPINDALDYEDELSHAIGGEDAHHEALFTRSVQELGGVIGLVIFGIALGLIFAVTLASVAPTMGRITPLRASLVLGVVGFLAVVVVPFLKYPANPPAVGNEDTVNERTVQYFSAVALSILLVLGVWRFLRTTKLVPVARAWSAAGLYAAGLTAIFLLLPDSPDEVVAPVEIVWPFRLAALGGLATGWTVLALTMGTLLTRDAAARASTSPTQASRPT